MNRTTPFFAILGVIMVVFASPLLAMEQMEEQEKNTAAPQTMRIQKDQKKEIKMKSHSSSDVGKLQSLDLKNLNIDETNVLRVSMKIRDKAKGFVEIDLSHNKIGTGGAWTLSKSLAYHPQITFINFSHNVISDEGAKYLASLSHLIKLDLSYNKISNSGAGELTKLANLTFLNLERNTIGFGGLKAIACKFGSSQIKKRIVNLKGNPLNIQVYKEEYAILLQSSDISNLVLEQNETEYTGRVENPLQIAETQEPKTSFVQKIVQWREAAKQGDAKSSQGVDEFLASQKYPPLMNGLDAARSHYNGAQQDSYASYNGFIPGQSLNELQSLLFEEDGRVNLTNICNYLSFPQENEIDNEGITLKTAPEKDFSNFSSPSFSFQPPSFNPPSNISDSSIQEEETQLLEKQLKDIVQGNKNKRQRTAIESSSEDLRQMSFSQSFINNTISNKPGPLLASSLSSLDNEQILNYGYQLRQRQPLQVLDFSSSNFDDSHARCILDGVLSNTSPNFLSLNMNHNRITDLSMQTLKRVILHPILENFDLSCNLLGTFDNAYAANEFIRSVQQAPSLKSLNLKGNSFKEEDKNLLRTVVGKEKILIEEASLPTSSSLSPQEILPTSSGKKYSEEDRQILRAKISNMIIPNSSTQWAPCSIRKIAKELWKETDKKWSNIDPDTVKGLLLEMRDKGIDIQKGLTLKAMNSVIKYENERKGLLGGSIQSDNNNFSSSLNIEGEDS